MILSCDQTPDRGTTNLRLLAIIPESFGGSGGVAQYYRDILSSLAERENCREILILSRGRNPDKDLLPEKISYVSNYGKSKLLHVFRVIQLILKEKDFSVIICGHLNLLPLAVLASWRAKCPLVLSVHGIEAWEPTPRVISNLCTRFVSHVTSVTNFTLQRFLTWARCRPEKTFVIPPAVRLDRFCPGPKRDDLIEAYSLSEKTILLTLCRLNAKERYKGVDEVLEQLSQLVLEYPNLVYLVAGEGDDRERLEKKADALGLKSVVRFIGFVEEEVKPDIYRLADAFLMPGRGEGFGIVYLEALASGLPVLGSKLDGSSEALLGGGLGVLVDPNNARELKSGIVRTFQSKSKTVPEELSTYSTAVFDRRIADFSQHFSA